MATARVYISPFIIIIIIIIVIIVAITVITIIITIIIIIVVITVIADDDVIVVVVIVIFRGRSRNAVILKIEGFVVIATIHYLSCGMVSGSTSLLLYLIIILLF